MASNAFLSRFGNRMSVVGRDGTVSRVGGEGAAPAQPERGHPVLRDQDSSGSIGVGSPASTTRASASQPQWGKQLTVAPPPPQHWQQPVPSQASPPPAAQLQPPAPTTKQVPRRPTAAELSALASQESVHFGLPVGARPRLSPRGGPDAPPRHFGQPPPVSEQQLPPRQQPAPPSLLFPYANASAAPLASRKPTLPAYEGEMAAQTGGHACGLGHDGSRAGTAASRGGGSPRAPPHPPASRLSAVGSSHQYDSQGRAPAQPPPPHILAQMAQAQAAQPQGGFAPPGGSQQAQQQQWAQAQWQAQQWAQAQAQQQAQWARMQQMQWQQQQQQLGQQQQQQQQLGQQQQQQQQQQAWAQQPPPAPPQPVTTVAQPHPLMRHPPQRHHAGFSEWDGSSRDAPTKEPTGQEKQMLPPRQTAGRRGAAPISKVRIHHCC